MAYLPYLLIAGGVFIVLLLFAGPITKSVYSLAAYLPSRKPSQVIAQDGAEDALDLDAFKRVKNRMHRLKCPEGIAAIATVGQHFLHDAEAHP